MNITPNLPPELELGILESLADDFPTGELALSEIAAIEARLTLPRPVTHVVSDVHGEFGKLRHVINNASGMLRTAVDDLLGTTISEEEKTQFMAVLYYPHELHRYIEEELSDPAVRRAWVKKTLRRQFTVVRELAHTRTGREVEDLAPEAFRRLFGALYKEPFSGRLPSYVDTMLEVFAREERDLDAVRAASRLIRNLAVNEIIVAGDFGDRGPRMDKVIDYLQQQPNVAFTWGNHDASWMGACLGSDPLIANVLRISLRYRRLFQLEEGYGILLLPLEQLAQSIYGEDPATRFVSKNAGLRDALLVARMQKAAAILQFKLEGQMILRHPEWHLEHRSLLHRIDWAAGTVEIDGVPYPLGDLHLPTIDPADPYRLSTEEADCMARLRESFLASTRLWEHMKFLVRRGAMWLVRDEVLIFHGCVPVEADGSQQALEISGNEVRGRAMFEAFDALVRRCFRRGAFDSGDEIDWFWYLWCGPRSPLFGKDKVATFENYFVDDIEIQHETKNAYFNKIHDAAFCDTLAKEFGVQGNGLIVNGHVPVKVEGGEDPVKRGGNAVTIDGAFSEAYGDHGYSLLLTPDRIDLAKHHHFEGVGEAVLLGADIVPEVRTIRHYAEPRRVGDGEEGTALRSRAGALEALIHAYQSGRIFEQTASGK